MKTQKSSYLHKHMFKKALRPTVVTKSGREAYVDYIETSPDAVTDVARKHGVSPKELCVSIGEEFVRQYENAFITKELDEEKHINLEINVLIENHKQCMTLTLKFESDGLISFFITISAF